MTIDLDTLAAKAAAIVTQRLNTPATLQPPVVIKDETRSVVLRCRVKAGRSHAPTSVIIKQMRDDLTCGYTEWASLEFLASMPAARGLVPLFLGGDTEHHFLVLEDLGGSRNVEDVLQQADAQKAEATLRSLAQTVARLQAATFGQESSFNAVRRTLPHGGSDRHPEADNALDCPLPDQLERCLYDIAGLYANPGPFLCFSHGDPAPTNNHVAAAHVRLLDFEYGAFRHALYDLTGWYILCPLPGRVIANMSRDFRHEFGKAHPVFMDDEQYEYGWAALSAYRALSILTWIGPEVIAENRPWADAQWTCRHAVIAALLRMREATSRAPAFAPVTAAADRLASLLLRRWPEFQSLDEVTPAWLAFRE